MPYRVTVRIDVPGIYLDHQATTPVDHRVSEAMWPYMAQRFGNPHSNTHSQGLDAKLAVETARAKFAKAIGSKPKDVIFTSGATESNNLAILGVAKAAKGGKRFRVITQATEHSSVLGPVSSAASCGLEVVVLGVGRDGLVDLDKLDDAVDEETLLVSMMLVNNETGVVQPVSEIGKICSRNGTLLHSDCAQALGKVRVDISALGVDLASFSAHKAYGPKGIGGLFVRNLGRAPIEPIMFGGGQEAGLRSGTLPVPLCVGFGKAAEIAEKERTQAAEQLSFLESRLWEGIKRAMPDAGINGGRATRAPGCLNIHFPKHQADGLIATWHGLQVANGSACEAAKTRSSHVLRAMGASRAHANASLRIGLGRFTSVEDVDEAVRIISATSEAPRQEVSKPN